MRYDVIVTPAAEADILSAFAYIEARSQDNAERWLRGLYTAIHRLETFPLRFGRAREAELMDEDLRQMIFQSYRVVFLVERDEKIVRVVRVIHGARDVGSREEQPEVDDE